VVSSNEVIVDRKIERQQGCAARGRDVMTCSVEKQRSLLIIDDDRQILKLLRRQISVYFDYMETAETIGEAERHLQNHIFTHLISDLNLGPNEPNGFDIVTRLRKLFPGIQTAVVFTAQTPFGSSIPPTVDKLVEKSADLDELFKALDLDKWQHLGKSTRVCPRRSVIS
jgi:ActR/RegA family two-component response regulator